MGRRVGISRTLKRAAAVTIENLPALDFKLNHAYQNITFSFLEEKDFTCRLSESTHKKVFLLKNRFFNKIYHEISTGKKIQYVKVIPEKINKICLIQDADIPARLDEFTLYISPYEILYKNKGENIIQDISNMRARILKTYNDFCELIGTIIQENALQSLERYIKTDRPIENLYMRLSAQKKISMASILPEKNRRHALSRCFTDAELDYITNAAKDPESKLGQFIRKSDFTKELPKPQPDNSRYSTAIRQSAAEKILSAIKTKTTDRIQFNQNQLNALQEKNEKLSEILTDFSRAGGQLPPSLQPEINIKNINITASKIHQYAGGRQNQGIGILDFFYKLCFLTHKTAAVKISASAKLSVAITAIKKGHQFIGFFAADEIGALTEKNSRLGRRVYNYIKAGGQLPKQLNQTPAISQLI